jgi:hypothetical protein
MLQELLHVYLTVEKKMGKDGERKGERRGRERRAGKRGERKERKEIS